MSAPNWRCPDASIVLPVHATREQWLNRRRQGLGGSDMAVLAGVSHTLVQQLRAGKDSAGRPKKYVNLYTAQQIETAWDIPPSLVFMPELLDGRSTAA